MSLVVYANKDFSTYRLNSLTVEVTTDANVGVPEPGATAIAAPALLALVRARRR